MKWHNLISFLRALWHLPAGPMNWKNPIRVLAVAGWSVFQDFGALGMGRVAHASFDSSQVFRLR